MGFKKGLIFTLFLLLGILLGSVLTEVAQSVSFLRFFIIGTSIGVGTPTPLTIDLSIIKLQFGFSINVNVAVVLCIIGSLFVYHKVGKNI